MLFNIRCWIAQLLMPKELRIYFQLFLIEKIKEIEQELEDIAYGKTESEGISMIQIEGDMSNLEKAKKIVKEYYKIANCGIFNSRNWVGDDIATIYEDEDLEIDVCYYYSYFEVFGLSDAEFEELEKYYDSLDRK